MPAEVWAYILLSFASQSHARVINVHMALSTTKKTSDMNVSKYVTKMKTLADEMTSAGKKLDDEDLVSYNLAGLDADFNPLLSFMDSFCTMSNGRNFVKPLNIMLQMQQEEVTMEVLVEVLVVVAVAEAGVILVAAMAFRIATTMPTVTCSFSCAGKSVTL
jgi:hypothetical protein